MKRALILVAFLLLVACKLETPIENQCKQDYDCGKCVDRVLFGMSCERGYCDASTQYTQFDCTQEIKREFGDSFKGTCVDDAQGAHCAVAAADDGQYCSTDAECSRCAGKMQYTRFCNAQSHQCEHEETAADCDAIIGAQFGKPGTCEIENKQALCVVLK